MPVYRRPKKSALQEFTAMIVPGRLEEAFARVKVYYNEHLQLSFEGPQGVAKVLDDLLRTSGEPARRAVYALLCEPENTLYRSASAAYSAGGASAVVERLEPLVTARFRLSPAEALRVVALAALAFEAHGEQAVCEELAQQHRKAARRVRQVHAKRVEKANRAPSTRERSGPDAGRHARRPAAGPAAPRSPRRKPPSS